MTIQPTHSAAWPAWRYLARLIAFRPWLWGPNAAFIIAVILLETVPAVVARSFFDWLSTGVSGSFEPLWWLLALVGASAIGRVAFLVGCQLTNAPFIYTTAALVQHNLLRRLLELPAAVALPHSSGEALSRFRDDAEETANFLIPFNDLLAWTAFSVVGFALMLSINPTITVGVFLPLVVITGVVTRTEPYRRVSARATQRHRRRDRLPGRRTVRDADHSNGRAEERVVPGSSN